MTGKLKFEAVKANQSDAHQVFCFPARASDILKFASIEQISRDEKGGIKGFQRPQITKHINDIRDYLKSNNSVLPNPIVIAFIDRVEVKDHGRMSVLEIDISNGPPGLVVDGQQRLAALSGIPDSDFEVFVSILICKDEAELRRQFILINNTRPLPKSLIYELLPTVDGLPDKMSSRAIAAKLTDALNYQEGSSLQGQIKQHTNPSGVLTDTCIQRMILNSLSDGVCRELIRERDEQCFHLLSNYFAAVQSIFPKDWEGHKPKSSRLVHGAGIVAMGYVMELLCARDGATTQQQFETGLAPLVEYTNWSRGEWHFDEGETRPWNGIQNISRDVQMLASFLTRILKRENSKKIVELKASRI
ncbi:DGQHR domain-containing protein DpdB [Rhodospirillales bacterium]|nr:DGQHR domain-containing protein DpdB [Rhodospirillales bacterium]